MLKTERKQKILAILLDHSEGITGEELARRLHVSSRTVRSDIKKLQERLSGYKSRIVSSPNRGYRIVINEQRDELMAAMGAKSTGGLGTENERCDFIIGRLLECYLEDAPITQMDLAEEMYIGISTLKTYLSIAKLCLEEYSLQIAQYKTEGIRLVGEEVELRYCLVDYLGRTKAREGSLWRKVFEPVSFATLNQIISHVLEIRNLQLTDISRENLCIHAAVLLWRSRENHSMPCTMHLAQQLEEKFEYSAAKDIVSELFRYTGVDVSYSEVYYITQCLLTSKKLVNVDESVNKEHVRALVHKILLSIKDKLALDFTEDQYLVDGLLLHLSIAIARVQFHMNIRNELLESIKKDYPLAFQMGVIAAKTVSEIDDIEFNENEISYIALHFGAAISRNSLKEAESPKNVIIVCSAGLGVSVLLKAKVEEHFHNRINVVAVLPSYEINQSAVDGVDYVFTTVPLEHIDARKVIRINHMLRLEDIEKIERKVFDKSVVNAEEIRSFFSEENFYINQNFKTKEECINFLTDRAIESGLMNKKAKQSVFERERMSSTAIGDLAAIPHPMCDASLKSSISILILDKPIVWDDLPVMVVFLLNIEYSKSALWESAFLKLYEYIKNKGGVSSMLQHKSYEIFLKEYLSMF